MKKCALLTMDNLDNFIHYDVLLNKPLENSGWDVDYVSWRDNTVDWNGYHVVIIRSPWDYQNDYALFIKVLKKIEKSNAVLINSLAIVEWNINKKYMLDLQEDNVEIVPTYWLEEFDFSNVEKCFNLFETNQIIVKPTISANADNTFWLKKDNYQSKLNELEYLLHGKQLMVQPFVPAVIEEGEYSLFYFAGEFSHCVLKKPKTGDFRVQEEFGSTLKSIVPSQRLLQSGDATLKAIPEPVLYARVDLVEYQQSYKLMELELIEPSLYFNYDDKSPNRFVKALNKWMK